MGGAGVGVSPDRCQRTLDSKLTLPKPLTDVNSLLLAPLRAGIVEQIQRPSGNLLFSNRSTEDVNLSFFSVFLGEGVSGL